MCVCVCVCFVGHYYHHGVCNLVSSCNWSGVNSGSYSLCCEVPTKYEVYYFYGVIQFNPTNLQRESSICVYLSIYIYIERDKRLPINTISTLVRGKWLL